MFVHCMSFLVFMHSDWAFECLGCCILLSRFLVTHVFVWYIIPVFVVCSGGSCLQYLMHLFSLFALFVPLCTCHCTHCGVVRVCVVSFSLVVIVCCVTGCVTVHKSLHSLWCCSRLCGVLKLRGYSSVFGGFPAPWTITTEDCNHHNWIEKSKKKGTPH